MKERGLTGKQGQSEARRIVNEMDIDFRGEAETQFRKERKEKRSSTKPTVLGEKEQKILSKSPVSSADFCRALSHFFKIDATIIACLPET